MKITEIKFPNRKDFVYILSKRGRIIYVGETDNIMRRIGEHAFKGFDKVSLIECPRNKRKEMERRLIRSLSPEMNCIFANRQTILKQMASLKSTMRRFDNTKPLTK